MGILVCTVNRRIHSGKSAKSLNFWGIFKEKQLIGAIFERVDEGMGYLYPTTIEKLKVQTSKIHSNKLSQEFHCALCAFVLYTACSTGLCCVERTIPTNDPIDVVSFPCELQISRLSSNQTITTPNIVFFDLEDEQRKIRFQVESPDDTEAKFFIGKSTSEVIEIDPNVFGQLELTVPSIRLTFDRTGTL